MSECEICGKEVKKLLAHPMSKKGVCYQCLSKDGFFSRDVSEHMHFITDEKRSSLRIPLSICLSFELPNTEGEGKTTYEAISVDLSITGVCFAWEQCKDCNGYKRIEIHPDCFVLEKCRECKVYKRHSVHPNCLFYPYSVNNDYGKDLDITFKLSEDYSLILPCRIANVLQEDDNDIEYVGASFSKFDLKELKILEILIIEYGRLK